VWGERALIIERVCYAKFQVLMRRYCPNCGHEMADGTRKCPHCIDETEWPPQPTDKPMEYERAPDLLTKGVALDYVVGVATSLVLVVGIGAIVGLVTKGAGGIAGLVGIGLNVYLAIRFWSRYPYVTRALVWTPIVAVVIFPIIAVLGAFLWCAGQFHGT